jgi:hypothetical protein
LRCQPPDKLRRDYQREVALHRQPLAPLPLMSTITTGNA